MKITNKCLALLILILLSNRAYSSEESSLITCQNQKNSTIKTMVIVVGDNPLLKQAAKIIAFDLAFTDQLTPEIKCAKKALNKRMIKKLFKDNYSLCIQLTAESTKNDKNIVGVQIKETEKNETVFEKTFACTEKSMIVDSHSITSSVIPALTGHNSIALSSLAYCEQYAPSEKGICVTDYACFTKKLVLKDKTLNIAPAWHPDAHYLFYSRFTKQNSQLRCFDFTNNKSRVICSYDGINMQPTCSHDGKQVVLSMSGTQGNTELYLYDQKLCKLAGKRFFKQLTKNGGCNVSPTLLPDGNIIFCSDFETGSPQIYHLEPKNNIVKRITNKQGYCAGPSFHSKSNTIVYSRLLDGAFQLFSIDLKEKKLKERQLTSSQGDKLNPTWSPCGRYVAFTYDFVDASTKKRIPQVAVLNYHSGTIRILTKDAVPKSFVAWTDRTHYHC